MNEERETVEPPMKARIGPKFGIDSATNRTERRIDTRITTRLTLNLVGALKAFSAA